MVYKFNDEQYALMQKYIKSCIESEYVKPRIQHNIVFNDELQTVTVQNTDIVEFMSAADDAIIEFGMVNEDHLNSLGCKLQLLYDEIYYQTKHASSD